MRVAALMPTRNRPACARRAVSTFLTALKRVPGVDHLELVIADDSDRRARRPGAFDHPTTRAAESGWRVSVVAVGDRDGPDRREGAGSGAGAARNAALAVLRDAAPAADLTVMFDDDVRFADATYRSMRLACDGGALLREAFDACRSPRTVMGCSYAGRQDLSILEHILLLKEGSAAGPISPACDRGAVEHVGPGGISTAFLAIGAAPGALPDMPTHYNEDYAWLHRLSRSGWSLLRSSLTLPHVPPGALAVSREALHHQVLGEIVWLAVLEADRFPAEDARAMAAAVDEILGDVEAVLADPRIGNRGRLRRILASVASDLRRLRDDAADARRTEGVARLKEMIRAGLRG